MNTTRIAPIAQTPSNAQTHIAPLNQPHADVTSQLLKRALGVEIDPNNPPPPEEPIFYVAEKLSSTAGNLTAITAKAKLGKSSIVGSHAAACIVAAGLGNPDADTLGIRSTAPNGKAVLLLDTEQSPSSAATLLQRTLQRAGLEATESPEWLHLFAQAGWTPRDLDDALPILLEYFNAKHNGIHAVFIDGGADFAENVNDPQEAARLCAHWHGLAIRYRCAIIVVIHTNEGDRSDDIARGWLGKQLRRKAESNLLLKKRDSITVLYGDDGQRRAPITEAEGSRFLWSDSLGMHISETKASSFRDAEKDASLHALATEVFSCGALPYAEAITRIQAVRNVGEKAGQKWFTTMKKASAIEQIDPTLWNRRANDPLGPT